MAHGFVHLDSNYSPCPGKKCREVCTYELQGKSSGPPMNAKVTFKIKTIFDNRGPELIIRISSQIPIRKWGAKVMTLKVDENGHFDPIKKRLKNSWHFNSMKVKFLKRKAKFRRIKYSWRQDAHAQGAYSNIRPFSRHNPPKEWGIFSKKYLKKDILQDNWNWIEDFKTSKPAPGSSSYISNFSESLLLGMSVPFFMLRFAPGNQMLHFAIFYGKRDKDTGIAIHHPKYEGKYLDNNAVEFTGDISFHDFKSDSARIVVNQKTHQFTSINFVAFNQDKSQKLTISSKSFECQIK